MRLEMSSVSVYMCVCVCVVRNSRHMKEELATSQRWKVNTRTKDESASAVHGRALFDNTNKPSF